MTIHDILRRLPPHTAVTHVEKDGKKMIQYERRYLDEIGGSVIHMLVCKEFVLLTQTLEIVEIRTYAAETHCLPIEWDLELISKEEKALIEKGEKLQTAFMEMQPDESLGLVYREIAMSCKPDFELPEEVRATLQDFVYAHAQETKIQLQSEKIRLQQEMVRLQSNLIRLQEDELAVNNDLIELLLLQQQHKKN